MWLQMVLLLIGFGLLTVGADTFVNGSVGLAKVFGVPNMVIGLTIVALGTSAPEIVVSVSAALEGAIDMVIGNAVGSNLFNLLLVLGLLAVIKPLPLDFGRIDREHYLGTGAAGVFLLMQFVFEDRVPQWVPWLFLLTFVGYMIFSIKQALATAEQEKLADELASRDLDTPVSKYSLGKSVLLLLLGMGMIVAGGQLAVNNAVLVAQVLGMSDRLIGLTILAVGTSMPEVVTSLVALKKDQADLAVGNMIGSSFFNMFFIPGVAGVIVPLQVHPSQILDLALLVGVSLLFILIAKTGNVMSRLEGALFLCLYGGYMVSLVVLR